eukprot:5098016-Pyramimonas_sp.AAC.1
MVAAGLGDVFFLTPPPPDSDPEGDWAVMQPLLSLCLPPDRLPTLCPTSDRSPTYAEAAGAEDAYAVHGDPRQQGYCHTTDP